MIRRERGFTLIEALVAFAVLAVVLGLSFQVFSGGLSRIETAGRYTEAVAHAESLLQRVGPEFVVREGRREVELGKPFDAEVTLSERALNANERGDRRPIPMDVAVRVSWHEGDREREIVLQSVRLAPAP